MKKLVYSIITLVYLLVSTGMGINVHYCMGEISSVEFHESEKKTCGKCGMEEKKGGCCSNQKQFYKYDHPSKYQEGQVLSFSIHDLPVSTDYFQHLISNFATATVTVFSEHKPDPGGPPIYLRNNVFRL